MWTGSLYRHHPAAVVLKLIVDASDKANDESQKSQEGRILGLSTEQSDEPPVQAQRAPLSESTSSPSMIDHAVAPSDGTLLANQPQGT